MKRPIFLSFLACAALSHPAQAQAIDAVRVSPDRYRVLLDNPEVRVVEYVLQPGQREAPAYIAPPAPTAPAAPRAPMAPTVPTAFIAPTGGGDCIARMADTPGRGSSTIETAKLVPGNPMPGFLPSAPRRIVISVVVDSAGRADPTTLQVPPELDSAGVNGLRTVLPQWRFVPARVSGCPVKQVVRVTFTR